MPTFSVINTPYLYSPVSGEIWINNLSGSYSVSDFKYIYNINKVDQISLSKTPLGEFKIPPRPVSGYGLFSPNKLLRSSLSYDFQPFITNVTTASHSLMMYNYNYGCSYNPGFSFSVVNNSGLNSDANVFLQWVPTGSIGVGDLITLQMNNQNTTPVLNGTASVIGIFPTFGSMSFVEIDKIYATPSLIPDQGIITQLKQYIGTSSNYYAFNGTRQYDQPNVNYNFQTYYVFDANPNNVITNVLTNKPVFKIGNNEWETISVIIDEFAGTYSGVTYSLTYDIIAYDKNNAQVGVTHTFLMSAAVSDIRYKRYDIPIGTGNIIGMGLTSSLTGVDHYDLFIVTSGGTNSVIKYGSRYNITDVCSPYTNVRLAFQNRLGGIDYQNFERKNVNSLNKTTTEFRKTLPFDYTVGVRQDSVLSVKANEVYTISTDWITESESNWLKELITSPEVYWITSSPSMMAPGLLTPIIITDNSYTVKTLVTDKMFCLTINFKLATDINIQNM